ncbi:hypothetical protein ACFSX5_10565 [Devosia albogilva]|uniref:Helix-turn-helix domain-containing protein n=1 Tax=Devosia albogilva TaxID=429726 RepID=A0ABW5QKM8_9HYPH
MTKHEDLNAQASSPEAFITLKQAAACLGLPYFKIQRAARQRIIPTYRVYNSRRLVRLSEVVALINDSRVGGV